MKEILGGTQEVNSSVLAPQLPKFLACQALSSQQETAYEEAKIGNGAIKINLDWEQSSKL